MNIKSTAEKDPNIICAYLYGSQVYKTNTEKSDHDFICVVNNKEANNQLVLFGDVTNYTVEEFQNLVNQHEISVLECLFLKDEFVLKQKHNFDFSLNKELLRNSISAKSSNSWVKAKKKFIIEEDFNPYIGKKSAWHSLRILNFGTQIAKNGKIEDYSQCNDLFKKVMECNSWEEINEKFKTTYNEMASEFKRNAPKMVIQENKFKSRV